MAFRPLGSRSEAFREQVEGPQTASYGEGCASDFDPGRGSLLLQPPAFADKIDDAAKKLSDASYPFLKEIDWTADYAKNIPGADPLQMAKAISKTIDMGAAIDPSALKAGVLAHSKAIGSIDANGLTSKADYEAINAAIGHMVSSAGEAKTLDVYNAWAGVVAAAVRPLASESRCTSSAL